VTQKLEDQPNITSHSFRAGYITQLWRNTNDIEVRPPSNRPRQHISIELYVKANKNHKLKNKTK